uniref:Non-specific lipid-transfer protein 1 n=1 Tax=Lens culinaris TaxID=3864 RepID=NLTP1_LENCU|nr:RecName: Full=Non-specific lipid-transfer protein 1; Short=LTP1; Flags: Precursor [Lens culinaris]AAX35806.1 lipid transfer protein 1 precursor [Lens culinaris]
MASLRVSCLVALMCMVVISAPMAEAAISCGTVSGALVPCLTYLKGGPGPSPQCCGGVKRLNGAARTTIDRRAACNCLKSSAGSISGLKPGNVATLPGKCGVRLPYTISTSTNCNTIRF